MLCTDASSFLPYVVEDKRLESFSYCFGTLHVVKSFHYCVQVEVAIGDVPVAEDSAAVLVHLTSCNFYYFIKIFRVQWYIKFEGLYINRMEYN